MLIRFLNGPRQGQTAHAPRSQETDLLLGAGLIEVVKEPIPAPTVTWAAGVHPLSQRAHISACCARPICTRFAFEGTPEQAKNVKFTHSCGGDAMPESIPDEIIATYKQLRANTNPVIGLDEQNFYAEKHMKYSREKKVDQWLKEHGA